MTASGSHVWQVAGTYGDGKLSAGRVGDVLLPIILAKRPAALGGKHLRHNHRRALQRAVADRTTVACLVPGLLQIAHVAAIVAVHEVFDVFEQRRRSINHRRQNAARQLRLIGRSLC